MAKKKAAGRKRADGSPTNASVIRDIHTANKKLGPTDVARAAAEKLGIAFSQSLVSQASGIINKGGKKKGRKKKAGATAVAPSSGSLAHDLMEAAKEVEVAIQKFTEQAASAIGAKIRQMIATKK